ncbi:phosphoribosylanthranilate isomerase [Gracilibacillus alcaliphilus]|uniref:phosphoribosylanthranilate isomerase n=1 Tax=Gracilibacillus alcaliphilus TaxID=1401441 RepID=UPI001EF84ECD|nr:phosphoribosylanthranilate isomerase [Gracilibacillus alcaliphilus]MBM7679146.1 phosphoribosylanthranilate isomerase [Gracilibacillus alcaliphilus]
MTQVKICGLRDPKAIRTAVAAGADFIGFVFAKSKRQVTKEEAAALAAAIPEQVKKVGVFVNEEIDTVHEIAEAVGLDYIQLHGDETPAYCQALKLPIIKAFEVHNQEDLERLADYDCGYYLLDSPADQYRGGSGKAFDWSLTTAYDFLDKRILLAGGLDAHNVAEAIQEVRPAGVDVSSGVETDGVKDFAKIKAFIQAAKKGDDNHGL